MDLCQQEVQKQDEECNSYENNENQPKLQKDTMSVKIQPPNSEQCNNLGESQNETQVESLNNYDSLEDTTNVNQQLSDKNEKQDGTLKSHDGESEEGNEFFTHLALLSAFIVLICYITFGAWAEHNKITFIHETGFGIILGMLVGLVFVLIKEEYYHQFMEFNPNFFMLFILPPIIFAGGYNLKKRRFFQNFFYIVLFGLFGTLINFSIVSSLTYLINSWKWVRRYSDLSQAVNLPFSLILNYSATICATDSVAALAMIKPEKYPKLFSVIFGEGMVNDSVAIILFQTVKSLFPVEGEQTTMRWYTAFEVTGDFLLNAFGAIAFGLITGLGGALITKHLRFISHNPVIETCLIFFLGFIAYMLAELLEWSGVIAILVSGISMSHYLYYNLSKQGQKTTGTTFSFISLVAEAFLYVYLGISVWQNKSVDDDSQSIAWSWTFFVLQLVIIFIARVTSIFGTSAIGYLFKRKGSWRLNPYELAMICYAGIIRGAIAFALIQTIVVKGTGEIREAVQIIQSTTIFIVIFTTVILGGTMPLFINWNIKSMNKRNIRQTVGSDDENNSEIKSKLLNKGESKNDTIYKGGTQKQWKSKDEKFLKNCFIYDYANRKDEILKEKKRQKLLEQFPEQEIKDSMLIQEEEEEIQRRMSQISGAYQSLNINDQENEEENQITEASEMKEKVNKSRTINFGDSQI